MTCMFMNVHVCGDSLCLCISTGASVHTHHLLNIYLHTFSLKLFTRKWYTIFTNLSFLIPVHQQRTLPSIQVYYFFYSCTWVIFSEKETAWEWCWWWTWTCHIFEKWVMCSRFALIIFQQNCVRKCFSIYNTSKYNQ